MNTPYVKQYDENGVCTNPIVGAYLNQSPGRSVRKRNPKRFYGESKNFHLTVTNNSKFLRLKQFEVDKKGRLKVIEHYIPR